MFVFVVRYLGFLKHIPGLGILFDNWLKVYSAFMHPVLLDNIDAIEAEVLTWPGTYITTHKYGGIQFNYKGKEIGHIHSNGLLDMLLSRKLKQELMNEGYIEDHHFLKNTGWISFYMHNKHDATYALKLLKLGYDSRKC